LKLLEGIGDGKIGMDSSIVPLRQKGLYMVSTTDYFYPLVDDPYIQGKIGCANVLSDLYAMGVADCDNMLMILAASTEMDKMTSDVVTRLMIEGFSDLAKEAGTCVTGGQTVKNPWPIIGGMATSVCSEQEFIMPVNAVDGDVIVLTKPLGTQVSVNLNQWKSSPVHRQKYWPRVQDIISEEEVDRAYDVSMKSMSRLNRTGAKLMHKYGAHAATDVTGFGIIGHGRNLAKNQKAAVNFEIHSLPIIRSMKEADDKVQMFSLLKGFSAETSGGLFVCLPPENAEKFCKEIEEIDGAPAWIIGRVVKSDKEQALNTCNLVENVTVIPA